MNIINRAAIPACTSVSSPTKITPNHNNKAVCNVPNTPIDVIKDVPYSLKIFILVDICSPINGEAALYVSNLVASHKALDNIYRNNIKYDRILADGNRFKPFIFNGSKIEHNCIINGDNRYIQIAAGSILAKTHRDEYIENLCNNKPELKIYGLMTNYGYGTKEHRDAIREKGYSEYHRKTFKLKSLK